MTLPPFIAMINAEALDGYTDGYYPNLLDGYTKNIIERQLYITEYISDQEFDTRVALDPSYPNTVHLQGQRLLVGCQDLRFQVNRSLADLVLFYSHGLISVLQSKVGPPGFTVPVDRVNMFDLLRDVGSPSVVILPPSMVKPPTRLRGIVADQTWDQSGVYEPNEDNLLNNPDFINRK